MRGLSFDYMQCISAEAERVTKVVDPKARVGFSQLAERLPPLTALAI